jgi:hypothetical protein
MVHYCNKALSMILLLYNLFYMFFTYGLHPNFVFTKYGRDTYIPNHVVDHESDTPIESFVVHCPNIGQVGPGVIALIIVYSDMWLRMT